jgi:hypothetical protein
MKKLLSLLMLVSLILTSCNSSIETKVEIGGPSSEDKATFEKQIESYTAYRKAFKEENIEDIMSLMADSLKWSPPAYNENNILGYDDVKSQFQLYFDGFDDITFSEGEGLVNPNAPAFWAGSAFSSGKGDQGASSSPNIMRVYGTWSGIHTDSGAKVYNKYYGVLNFNSDGKIAELSDWMDVSGMQVQIQNHIDKK